MHHGLRSSKWYIEARAFCEEHLFISYSHIDNQPLTTDQTAWVSRIHESLEAMLSMRLGRNAEIWRDLKLSGGDICAKAQPAMCLSNLTLYSRLHPRT